MEKKNGRNEVKHCMKSADSFNEMEEKKIEK
jgi:hypothetical protein